MSKFIRDYTGFAAKVNSEIGIVQPNARFYPMWALRLLLICLILFTLPTKSAAQPPFDDPVWVYHLGHTPTLPDYTGGGSNVLGQWAIDGRTGAPPGPATGDAAFPGMAPYQYLYTQHANVTGGNRWTNSFVSLAGSVRGVQNAALGGRGTHWWVGNDAYATTPNSTALFVDGGRIHQLDQLTVQGGLANDGSIDAINTINVHGNVWNYAGGSIGAATDIGYIYTMTVAGTLFNNAPTVLASRATITNVIDIRAGVLHNMGLIQQVLRGGFIWSLDGQMDASIQAGTLINGNNRRLNSDGSARERRESEIITSWGYDIDVSGDFFQYFDGSVRAREGTLNVGGTLYNAGEIRMSQRRPPGTGGTNGLVTDADWWDDLNYNHGWNISALDLYNDGRLWSQWTDGSYRRSGAGLSDIEDTDIRAGGTDALLGAWGIIYDAIHIDVGGNLTNIGANAVINGSVDTHDGSFMHVVGGLYNLDRASIFNYQEVVVHGDFENRGATFVGGSWFRHSYLTTNDERSQQNRATGIIDIGGNVINRSELATGGEIYGGLIASFDRFDVGGSLYNDANSLITGTYAHQVNLLGETTAPLEYGYTIVPVDPITGLPTIYGRRASISNGVMYNGNHYRTSASELNVRGLFPDSTSIPAEPTFRGLYNAGHIREIDIINVGVATDERTVLWNAFAVTAPGATLPTSNGGEHQEMFQPFVLMGPAGTITDIGVINTANLINEGTISDIDVAINVSYALINTGLLDGLSTSHIQWFYPADGSAPIREVVLQETHADLRVGAATAANEYVDEGVGIYNAGTIMNFGVVSTLGDFYNAGILQDVRMVDIGGDLVVLEGSDFGGIGTVTAFNDVLILGDLEGGFGVLDARTGNLIVGMRPIPGVETIFPTLTVDSGAVASGSAVENWGTVINDGFIASRTSFLNEGTVVNNGAITLHNNFFNWGTVGGTGRISVTGAGSQFVNEITGTIDGGLVIDGGFRNHGHISHTRSSDFIRVTSGIADIRGGTVSATYDAVVGSQYLFLMTDQPGELVVQRRMRVEGSGEPGSVLDFSPTYGSWNGSRFVAGGDWDLDNQYYWLEVQRAYTYGGYGRTENQVAIGSYIDLVSTSVKQDFEDQDDRHRARSTGLWNLLTQLDGISDGYYDGASDIRMDRAQNPHYDQAYADHQGPINPAALRALDELSGSIYANLGGASVHYTGAINRNLADVLRSDVFKFSMIGNPNNAIRGQAIAPLRYSRWGTFFGVGGTTQHDGNVDGYRTSLGGIMFGVDRAMWTGTRVGAYVAAATGDISMKDLDESTDITNLSVGLYLRQEMYYGYGLVSVGLGRDTYKTKRQLNMIRHNAESKTNADIGTIYLERGIDIPVYYATLQPYTSFQLVSVSQEQFTERMWNQYGNRADVGLEGLKNRTNSYRLAFGTRASTQPIPMRWGQLATTYNIAWFHEFQSEKERRFSARFSNPDGTNFGTPFSSSKFTIRGSDPKRDWFNFGVGLNLDRNSTRIFLGGDLFANSRQTMFSGSGGFITSW